jgi:hypothetical protein
MADASTRKIKNKAVAQLQISAEQILLEAFERKEEPLKVPLQKFTDLEEVSITDKLSLLHGSFFIYNILAERKLTFCV